MSGINWNKARLRKLAVQNGLESAGRDFGLPANERPPGAPLPNVLKRGRAPISKAELRRQADELLKTWPCANVSQREPTTANISKPLTSSPQRGKSGRKRAKGASSRVTLPPSHPSRVTNVTAGLVVFADGACEPNPGSGGWGFVAYLDGKEIYAESGGSAATTNNIMELTGALMALRWMQDRSEPGRLLCDSQYVVNGCNDWRHGWKRNGWRTRSKEPVKNLDLWKQFDEVLTEFPLTLEWVKGHAGIVGNERADELSLIGRENALAAVPPSLIEQQLSYSA